ncbi:Hypothetical protein, putative [Bodo saltans]|uniref:Uncharacterized protein n=1 Tax=Bodo saltans TaxID=75058 RepID=A0A0S4J9P4_BODSA|nr:Hypothetical protein, putative [Bodo saltans]|eukprot:CUG86633.1 Hypothetical protein, putative [Bodo saltans]
MDRGRSTSSSGASSVSAPPSSRDERSVSHQSDVPIIMNGGGGCGGAAGRVVHTGFTSSSDGGSSSSRSSSFAGAAYRNATHFVSATAAPQPMTAAAIVHTGFTTSEDSGSVASRSRASSPSLSRPSSTAQLFAGASSQAQQRRNSQLLLDKGRGTPVAAQPDSAEQGQGADRAAPSAWEQAVGFRFASAATTARPLEQPAKADTTPRRKVTPVAPLGNHAFQQRQPQQQPPLGVLSSSSPPRHDLRGAGFVPRDDTVNNNLPLLWESALPPSTLLDLRMRLDILSNAKLAVREEELIKELQRTQEEMTRRGMPLTSSPQPVPLPTSQLPQGQQPKHQSKPNNTMGTTTRPTTSGDILLVDEFSSNDENVRQERFDQAEDEDWSEDNHDVDFHQRGERRSMTTPRHRSGGAGGRRDFVDTPVSPTASRLRQYAHNLLDMTQQHDHSKSGAGSHYRAVANNLSPLLKSPTSRAHAQQQYPVVSSSQPRGSRGYQQHETYAVRRDHSRPRQFEDGYGRKPSHASKFHEYDEERNAAAAAYRFSGSDAYGGVADNTYEVDRQSYHSDRRQRHHQQQRQQQPHNSRNAGDAMTVISNAPPNPITRTLPSCRNRLVGTTQMNTMEVTASGTNSPSCDAFERANNCYLSFFFL